MHRDIHNVIFYLRRICSMGLKSSNVIARVEPEIKEQAEAILSQLGISVSSGINMFYRQIILWNGLPFRPSLPSAEPKALEEMKKEEMDMKLSRALLQSHRGEGLPADDFFNSLREELVNLSDKTI